MKKSKIYTLFMAVGVLTLLSGCQKGGETTAESDTVAVRFNTFLKEGENITQFNVGSRSAVVGTLDNGFYLYAHAHKLQFATTTGNSYTTVIENMKVNADGTYNIPKFWLQDKTLLYSFQAYAATGPDGEIGTTGITVGTPPYVQSTIDTRNMTVDLLGAATYNIAIGDEAPTINLYFEHRLAKIIVKLQRINKGGPTIYDVTASYWGTVFFSGAVQWDPMRGTTTTSKVSRTLGSNDKISVIPSSEMGAVKINEFIYIPQSLTENQLMIDLTYSIEPGGTKYKLTTAMPAMKLESGKQTEVVVGYMVESEQLVINSVILTDWVTKDNNVQEYK